MKQVCVWRLDSESTRVTRECRWVNKSISSLQLKGGWRNSFPIPLTHFEFGRNEDTRDEGRCEERRRNGSLSDLISSVERSQVSYHPLQFGLCLFFLNPQRRSSELGRDITAGIPCRSYQADPHQSVRLNEMSEVCICFHKLKESHIDFPLLPTLMSELLSAAVQVSSWLKLDIIDLSLCVCVCVCECECVCVCVTHKKQAMWIYQPGLWDRSLYFLTY